MTTQQPFATVEHEHYRIISVRRPKNGILLIVKKLDDSGWKNRASRLAEALHGRWVHQHGGYIISRRAAVRFQKYYADGWDASVFSRTLQPPENTGTA